MPYCKRMTSNQKMKRFRCWKRRISNYILWQLAYSELYFCDALWPDFTPAVLEVALSWYAGRQRRFGRIEEQLKAGQDA